MCVFKDGYASTSIYIFKFAIAPDLLTRGWCIVTSNFGESVVVCYHLLYWDTTLMLSIVKICHGIRIFVRKLSTISHQLSIIEYYQSLVITFTINHRSETPNLTKLREISQNLVNVKPNYTTLHWTASGNEVFQAVGLVPPMINGKSFFVTVSLGSTVMRRTGSTGHMDGMIVAAWRLVSRWWRQLTCGVSWWLINGAYLGL